MTGGHAGMWIAGLTPAGKPNVIHYTGGRFGRQLLSVMARGCNGPAGYVALRWGMNGAR